MSVPAVFGYKIASTIKGLHFTDSPGTKVCVGCGVTKPLSQYRRRGADRHESKCSKCAHAKRDWLWRVENAARLSAQRKRVSREKKRAANAKHKRKRYASDPLFRLKHRVSEQIRSALLDGKKGHRAFDLVGYNVEELRAHLERQFAPGMSWANAGAWHIDHIRPVSSFDLSQPGAVAECWALSNLQPLWARDNLAKGAKYARAA